MDFVSSLRSEGASALPKAVVQAEPKQQNCLPHPGTN
jgi:hypothetical protein